MTSATDALRRVYGNINRNKVLRMADLGMFMPDQICKPLVGGSSPSAGTNYVNNINKVEVAENVLIGPGTVLAQSLGNF